MKFLVAEDDEDLRNHIVSSLIKKGHEVDEAVNGAEAFKIIQSKKYDGVIADLNMPLMGGMELLTLLGGEPPFGLYTTGQKYKWLEDLAKLNKCVFFLPEANLETILQKVITTFNKTVKDHTDVTNLNIQ